MIDSHKRALSGLLQHIPLSGAERKSGPPQMGDWSESAWRISSKAAVFSVERREYGEMVRVVSPSVCLDVRGNDG